MIGNTTTIYIIILGIISIGMPLFFLIYYIRKYPGSSKAILIGLSVFLVFSQVLETLFLHLINIINPQTLGGASNPYIGALFVSLSSGIFQEVGRYLGFLYLLKKFRSWKDGIAYGIGHGGIEAIIIGGSTAISGLIIIILSNIGFLEVWDHIISNTDPNMAGELMKSQDFLANTPNSFFLLISVERIFVFIIQLGLSLLVLYGVKKQKIVYLLYAIYFHTIVFYVPALLLRLNRSEYLQEGYLLIMAILALIFIIKSKAMFARSKEGLEDD